MIKFLVGVFVGCLFGVCISAISVAAKSYDEEIGIKKNDEKNEC